MNIPLGLPSIHASVVRRKHHFQILNSVTTANRWLQEENQVDSGYGVWVRDHVTREIVCIDYTADLFH